MTSHMIAMTALLSIILIRNNGGMKIGIRMSYGKDKNQTLKGGNALLLTAPKTKPLKSDLRIPSTGKSKHASSSCSGPIFVLGCRIFDLTKKNAAARKRDLNRRIAAIYRHHDNDTKRILHLIAENVESLSEEQVAEIGMVTKQTEEKLRSLKHLVKEKVNESNILLANKTQSLSRSFRNDITELRGMILQPDGMKEMETRLFEEDSRKLNTLDENIRETINKSRENYDMKFLLTTKYVGEKYASLEFKLNKTIKNLQEVLAKVDNNTAEYKHGLTELKKELEDYVNMSSPATKMEVMRVEESIHKKYSALTKAVNESIVKVETDLERALGKKLTAREKIIMRPEDIVERTVVRELERRFAKRYSNLEEDVAKNISRATKELRRSMTADMDEKYDALKKRVYKNLSVITGSVMRDIVLITQNIKDMWKSAGVRGWPDGHYCLYKYGGQCPKGFLERRSHVHKKSVFCCKKS